MELRPRNYEKVAQLIDRGVSIPNPLTVDIGDDVDITRISGEGVTLFPGCRIYGARTVISSGVALGAEAPVTLDDCRLGPRVELKGGYFAGSVFLEGATMGSAAQVRESCLLEEQSRGAHAVGLKQTILFPFVTVGSLINFCDCLMAGGTGPADHSEVGSSYIHFNFTPAGDKSTPSLFGDVPRGVMLDRPSIFLGGQGGAVGPLRVGYGTVVAAGSVLREDVLEEGQLIVTSPPRGLKRGISRQGYGDLRRVVRNNIVYLANLVALEDWYQGVRRPFFARQELGDLVYQGAMEVLEAAKDERMGRLLAMADKAAGSGETGRLLAEKVDSVCALFAGRAEASSDDAIPSVLAAAAGHAETRYLDWVGSLSPETRATGVEWLQGIVDSLCGRAGEILEDVRLFG